jgi:hypothetical protein
VAAVVQDLSMAQVVMMAVVQVEHLELQQVLLEQLIAVAVAVAVISAAEHGHLAAQAAQVML